MGLERDENGFGGRYAPGARQAIGKGDLGGGEVGGEGSFGVEAYFVLILRKKSEGNQVGGGDGAYALILRRWFRRQGFYRLDTSYPRRDKIVQSINRQNGRHDRGRVRARCAA